MSVCKAWDVGYVRFSVPDLGVMQAFLNDFGMIETTATADNLFMRGSGTLPFVHHSTLGEPGFAGFSIVVKDRAALEALAAYDGAAIEHLDSPGGGEVVRLNDPDGFLVEAVFGQSPVTAMEVPAPLHWNESGEQRRIAEFRRVKSGPSHVLRLGHVVLSVSDFRVSERWYKERFGFITSDEIQPAPGIGIGAFMRADRGDTTSDHHTLFLLQHPDGPRFLHAAFEVVDLDDLMTGRDHLLANGHQAVWGVGRHILGSQIFDYWVDPWGHEIEHWTDGDQLRASDGGTVATPDQLMGVQWGMSFPSPEENSAR